MSIFGIKQSSTTVIQNNFCDLDMITCQQINKKKTKQIKSKRKVSFMNGQTNTRPNVLLTSMSLE